MSQALLALAQQLTQAGKPFVLATVVWCERPTSAKPGAQALIQDDGRITGWIGGSCAQPVVIREAQRALREGDDPYLLRLGSPDTGIARREVRVFPMTCSSGGVLDIYIEPHLPQPELLLIGDSPIIAALQPLATLLNFSVTQLHETDFSQVAIDEQTNVLVATHGQYDEDVLEHVLRGPAAYIGMVGSRKRADTCRSYLRGAGLTEQQIARLKAPAGLDIGAVTPEEIASSILAELVQVRRRGTVAHGHVQNEEMHTETKQGIDAHANLPEMALDLVCGMMVETATARHRSTHDGRDFYFCCPACKRLFEGNPQQYLVHNER